MRVSNLFSLSAIVSVAFAADAPVINDNIPGMWAILNTPGGGDQDIRAQVSVASFAKGGVSMTVNINGGPQLYGGPFMYHIHEAAVPSNGNCTATGAHLDPQSRGESPPCDPTKPASCQVGDLSGKHGTCSQVPGCSKNFTDKYLSLTPGNPAYIGDKSFVLHYANKTRIACANFQMGNNTSRGSGGSSSGGGPSGGSSSPPPASTASGSASPAPSSIASSNRHISNAALLALIAAIGYAVL